MTKKVLVVGFLVVFAGGIALGYAFWGNKETKTKDALTLLSETAELVKAMNKEKQQLELEVATATRLAEEAQLASAKVDEECKNKIVQLSQEKEALQSQLEQTEQAQIGAPQEDSQAEMVASQAEESFLEGESAVLTDPQEEAEQAKNDLQGEDREVLPPAGEQAGQAEDNVQKTLEELQAENDTLLKELTKINRQNEQLVDAVTQLQAALAKARQQATPAE